MVKPDQLLTFCKPVSPSTESPGERAAPLVQHTSQSGQQPDTTQAPPKDTPGCAVTGGSSLRANSTAAIGGGPAAGAAPTPGGITSHLTTFYGEVPVANNGTHLHGSVNNNDTWQRRFDAIVPIHTWQYHLSSGAISQHFLKTLVEEWKGMLDRKWNAEHLLTFSLVVLQCTPGVSHSSDIRTHIRDRIKLWHSGTYFDALVSNTVSEVTSHTTGPPKPQSEDSRHRTFNSTVLSGQLRKAIRHLTNRDSGGVLDPANACTKTGLPVLEVLKSKHPQARWSNILQPGSYKAYPKAPDALPLDITAEHVKRATSWLSGAAGVNGIDGVELKQWFLCFGSASIVLHEMMAQTVCWLANNNPPWVTYCALMAYHLVALNKQPGTRPVGIGSAF